MSNIFLYVNIDFDTTSATGQDYTPVIWLSFPRKNFDAGPLNQIPRNGGKMSPA
jgi:hypothetical protein